MSITPYNKYKVSDLNGIKQPYVNSTAEFGYFGNLGNTSANTWYSMPTNLLTNNGIAIVDASGLRILSAGIYKLNLSIDCSATVTNNTSTGMIIYFNFGINKLVNTPLANITGSFGGTHGTGMFSFGSNANTYPGIISWITNAYNASTTTLSKNISTNNQLVYNYIYNNSSSGLVPQGILTTEITFMLNQATTIYFNIGGSLGLTMGKSYFTLQLISNTPPKNFIWTQSTGTNNWYSIASSSDGIKLAAVVYSGGIYTSSNYGQTFTQTSATAQSWISIASSSDGTKLAAVVDSGGIYTSINSGSTWTQTAADSRKWQCIASSSDGTKLAAVVDSGGIWTSTDPSNNIWTQQTSGLPSTASWASITSSSDGTKLAAVVSGGGIYTYNTSNNIWTQQTSGLPSTAIWYSIASSSDGTKLAAVVQGGYIYTSKDSGATWSTNSNSSGSKSWYSIASSSDGTTLAAVVNGGVIWRSTDSGATWNPINSPTKDWYCIASDRTGKNLAAVSTEGIYIGTYSY